MSEICPKSSKDDVERENGAYTNDIIYLLSVTATVLIRTIWNISIMFRTKHHEDMENRKNKIFVTHQNTNRGNNMNNLY